MGSEPQLRRGAALVIGVGDYAHDGVVPLRFAVEDADALAEVLTDPDICGFPDDQVARLTDKAATRDEIVKYLSEWLPARSRGAEIVVIYFAGHGVARALGKKEEGYLLPHDADPENPAARGVAMGELARWVDGLSAETVVVCLDCCHAGKALSTRGSADGPVARDVGIRPAVIQEMAGKGRFLMAACDEGQKSVEDPDLGHGLFTYHLLQGITWEGDRDGDGRVGVAELFEYVSEAVVRDAKKLGFSQKPWTASIAAGGEYISRPQPRRAGPKSSGSSPPGARREPSIEQIRLEDGPEEAVEEIGRRMRGADEPTLVKLLQQAAKLADPRAVRFVIPHLANQGSKAVSGTAHRAMQAIGIKQTFKAIEELARRGDEALGPVLDGLSVLKPQPDLVQLLERIVDHAGGKLLESATKLLDRKRLSLGFDDMARLFQDNHSPYELKDVLGQGQYTAAYLAHDPLAEMDVVVRVLREEYVRQAEIRKPFLEVCKRSIKFVHRNLVQTLQLGAFPKDNAYFVVRAHVKGVTLSQVLAGRPQKPGRRFTPLEVTKILRQLLAGLSVLHEANMCHGGVKPSNIFVSGDDRFILGDLAPALLLPATGTDKRLAYNYRYAAPEILRGDTAGCRADLYALGCVAYELFCGTPPFVSDRSPELLISHLTSAIPSVCTRQSELHPEIDVFLKRLLARDPAARPGVDEAFAALDALRNALMQPAPAPPAEGAAGAGQPAEPVAPPAGGLDGNILELPAAGSASDASSILADLDEPAGAAGEDSSVRVESPGLDRVLTGRPTEWAFDLSGSDEPIPADLVAGSGTVPAFELEEATGTPAEAHRPSDAALTFADPPDARQAAALAAYGITDTLFGLPPVAGGSAPEPPAQTGQGKPPPLPVEGAPPAAGEPSAPLVRAESLADYEPARTCMSVGGDRPFTLAQIPPPVPAPVEQTIPRAPPPPPPSAPQDAYATTAGGPPRDHHSPVPTRIGRFLIQTVLGEGAFGRVFRGYDEQLAREVAIKVPHRSTLTTGFLDRFLREARATATIHHPNVCPVYEVGMDGDLPYIVMHYVSGGSLAAHLDKWRVLAPRTAVSLARKLALGVAAAHGRGVVHRDLKPQNVLLDSATEQVFITDFGLARMIDQTDQSIQGQLVGTPAYMSPEQARGDTGAVGPPSDVYSLGVMLYRMLTGKHPFEGGVYEVLVQHCEKPPEPPSAVRRGLDPRLDRLVLKALEKKPADRYPSAKAFAEALAEYLRAIG